MPRMNTASRWSLRASVTFATKLTGLRRPVPESSAEILEATMHRLIPITRTMGIGVIEHRRNRVALKAPLGPNINHTGTAFGGSLSTLATLCGWALLHMLLVEQGLDATILIRKGTTTYLAPVHGDFEAICEVADNEILDELLNTLKRKGRAAIELAAEISMEDTPAVRFRGSYVVLTGKKDCGA